MGFCRGGFFSLPITAYIITKLENFHQTSREVYAAPSFPSPRAENVPLRYTSRWEKYLAGVSPVV